jgi:hypothetical protein
MGSVGRGVGDVSGLVSEREEDMDDDDDDDEAAEEGDEVAMSDVEAGAAGCSDEDSACGGTRPVRVRSRGARYGWLGGGRPVSLRRGGVQQAGSTAGSGLGGAEEDLDELCPAQTVCALVWVYWVMVM